MPNFACICLARGVEGVAVKSPDFRLDLGICVWARPTPPFLLQLLSWTLCSQKISKSLPAQQLLEGVPGTGRWKEGRGLP